MENDKIVEKAKDFIKKNEGMVVPEEVYLVIINETRKELIKRFEKIIKSFEDIEFEKKCKLNHEETDCLQCYTLHILNELKQQLQLLKSQETKSEKKVNCIPDITDSSPDNKLNKKSFWDRF